MRRILAVDNLSCTGIDGRARDYDSIAQHGWGAVPRRWPAGSNLGVPAKQHVDQAPSEEPACISALAGMFHVKH